MKLPFSRSECFNYVNGRKALAPSHITLDEVYDSIQGRVTAKGLWLFVREQQLPFQRLECSAFVRKRQAGEEAQMTADIEDTPGPSMATPGAASSGSVCGPRVRVESKSVESIATSPSVAASQVAHPTIRDIYRGLGKRATQKTLWDAVKLAGLPYTQTQCREFVRAQKQDQTRGDLSGAQVFHWATVW